MAEYIKRDAIKYELWAVRTACEPLMVVRKKTIDSIPAADVVPVIRGSWKLLRHDRFSDVYQCSQCGRKVSLTHGRDVLEQFPYCHCGAKMSAEGGSI